jgi:hypothetical protein
MKFLKKLFSRQNPDSNFERTGQFDAREGGFVFVLRGKFYRLFDDIDVFLIFFICAASRLYNKLARCSYRCR